MSPQALFQGPPADRRPNRRTGTTDTHWRHRSTEVPAGGFVWDRPKILSLLDSVAKNFPVGSVLLWQSRQELRSENRIGELDIELPRPDYPVNYLLDGQQRLSSICGAMFWKQDDPSSRWNIAYDLRTLEFIHLDMLEEPPPHQIRINKLADPAKFFQHVAQLSELGDEAEQLEAAATGFFNRFKDYKLATVTLGDMPLQDVAPIFERINSTGTPLTIVDLMRAATWSPAFDLIDAIDGVLADLSDKDFDGVDRKVILRNLSASAGGGFSTGSSEHEGVPPLIPAEVSQGQPRPRRTTNQRARQHHHVERGEQQPNLELAPVRLSPVGCRCGRSGRGRCQQLARQQSHYSGGVRSRSRRRLRRVPSPPFRDNSCRCASEGRLGAIDALLTPMGYELHGVAAAASMPQRAIPRT
jgi:hypothetical protein